MFNVDTVHVCPVAGHREIAERLLVTGPNGSWYLWMGTERERNLIEIPQRLAQWVADHPAMCPIEQPCMWFDVASLPVCPAAPAHV